MNLIMMLTILEETTPAWITTTQGLISLIVGLVGLISAGVSLYFGIKSKTAELKGKSKTEIWALIQNIADAAMKSAESTALAGADKKTMVIDAVKATLKASGIDGDSFMDQLSTYIDSCIAFSNGLQAAKDSATK